MSDQEQSNVNSEQEQEDDQQNSQEEQEDENQDQNDDEEDEDDENESGDKEGGSDEQEGSGEDGDQDKQQQEENSQEEAKKLPTFKIPQREPPSQFKFTSLLHQISSLSSSVDNFIGSLHSSNSGFNRRPYTTNYAAQQTTYQPRLQEIKLPQPPAQSRVVIMKDEDTQVDMKPQIIIQPTKQARQDPVIQPKPYKISSQSEKFLAQLYEENKRLKRWQANPTHPMNSYMTSFSGNNSFGGSGNGFYGSREKFERKQYEKGLINVEERNRQIDEAIMMLKRQEQDY